MADIFKKYNKNISYTIYDMFEVNLLQFYFLKMNNLNPTLGKISSKLNLINDLKLVEKYSNTKKKLFFYCKLVYFRISKKILEKNFLILFINHNIQLYLFKKILKI